jgi:hypothetical protein
MYVKSNIRVKEDLLLGNLEAAYLEEHECLPATDFEPCPSIQYRLDQRSHYYEEKEALFAELFDAIPIERDHFFLMIEFQVSSSHIRDILCTFQRSLRKTDSNDGRCGVYWGRIFCTCDTQGGRSINCMDIII